MKFKIMALTLVLVLVFGICVYAEEAPAEEAAAADDVLTEDAQQVEEYGNPDEIIASLVSEDGVFRKIEYSDDLTEFDVYVDVQQYDPALDNASLYWLYTLGGSEQSDDQILINIIDLDTNETIDVITYEPSDEWICPDCGNEASGNFCSICGTAKESQEASTIGDIIQALLSRFTEGRTSSDESGTSLTDVNDINTNINFFIFQIGK